MNLEGFLKYYLFRDTTQHGEFRLLRRLIRPGDGTVIVDVGANDGFYGSNSFPFIARGWRAVLIEPHPVAFAKAQARFAGRPNVACLNLACAETPGQRPLYIGIDGDAGTLATLCTDDHPHFRAARTDKSVMVAVDTLGNILTAQQIARRFAILSVDTEGLDLEVLRGLNLEQWRPRVIITEDFDTKIAGKYAYLKASGYRLNANLAANSIWVNDRD